LSPLAIEFWQHRRIANTQARRVQNGRFFGYVQGSAEAIAVLGDLLSSILNQNITVWHSSPAGVTIERTVVRRLSEVVGCSGFVGTLTSGGSAANLMGLAIAREAKMLGRKVHHPEWCTSSW
jgi:aromatic-L-amino-acid/L-tryptophan decarboxylase